MTRIVVVSDTHVPRFRKRFEGALERVAAEKPDFILHCGDFTTLDVADAFAAIAPFDGVAGNNDGPEIVERFGRKKILTFDGVRMGLVHGDGERGTTRSRAERAFAHDEIDVLLFGHSHIPICVLSGSLRIVNPGSPCDKRAQPAYSYAIVETGSAHSSATVVAYP